MGLDFLDVFVLIFIATVLLFALYMLFIYRKRKALENKVVEYEKILRQTGHFRVLYLEAIKQAEEAKKRIDNLKDELTSQKIRLVKQRQEIKRMLPEMRKIKKNLEAGDAVALKALEQRKITLRQQWVVLNELRKKFNLALGDLPQMNQKFISLQQSEQKCTQKWQTLRSTVMGLFNELHGQIEISSPREVLSGARE